MGTTDNLLIEPSETPASIGSTLVQVRNVSKRFGGVQALTQVNLELRRGEVHGLVGENGAGKSTLIKILTGIEQPDSGEILIDGKERRLTSAHVARDLGLVAMHQEPILFPDLDVAENIYTGRFPRTRHGAIDWRTMYQQAAELFGRIGIDPGVRTLARDLSVANRQLVEIARALSVNAVVLMMDEPTAVLSQNEAERLFDIVRSLRAQGLTIVFISHRINEIKELCDRVTVMRNGQVVATLEASTTTETEIIRLMVGREMHESRGRSERAIGEDILVVKGLTRNGVFEDVSFTVKAGEIVGLAGFVGAGRSEVARALFGVDPYDDGEVLLAGKHFRPRSPRDAIAHGLAYVPENRLVQGIFPKMSTAVNIVIPVLKELLGRLGLTSRSRQFSYATVAARGVHLAETRLRDPVIQLSGGNQQKAVLARWLGTKPKLLILDEPTHGIDVGAKAEVWQIVDEVAKSGVGILLISSEFQEIVQACDRIVVMHRGRVVDTISRAEASLDTLIRLSGGGTLNSPCRAY